MIKQSRTNVRIRVIVERPKAPERTGKERKREDGREIERRGRGIPRYLSGDCVEYPT